MVCIVALRLSGLTVVSRGAHDMQAEVIAELKAENLALTNDLFRYQGPQAGFDGSDLPFRNDVDARSAVAAAREAARANERFLMITFGANWCLDCRTLYRHLQDEEVEAYTENLFLFINVDVGQFNRNRELAAELGVDLGRGIPVAVFFDPEGRLIGATNEGELEPARFYTSKQILKFVRDVAEKSVIAAPDSIF
jgi:protein disulfide-isomerase